MLFLFLTQRYLDFSPQLAKIIHVGPNKKLDFIEIMHMRSAWYEAHSHSFLV